jgi:signal transduction histidine kinase
VTQPGRLVRHYFLISVFLISGGLITSGLGEIYFALREGRDQLARLQHEVTAGTAFKIEQYIQEIERDVRAVAKSRDLTENGLTPAFRFELRRLLSTSRAITEAVAFDLSGATRAAASRFSTTPQDRGERASSAALQRVKEGASYFGPVYFRRESEPYMIIAVPIERFAGDVIGILQSEVNLKYVWEVISGLHVGTGGYAYAVARNGDLIAHPDISLVLQRRNVGQLEQVRAAFGSGGHEQVTQSLEGKKVFSSSALIPSLDWAVFVEQPIEVVYGPLYASLLRTSVLLLVGLGMALLAGAFVARRVVRPLEALKAGVERIGRGDLAFRLDLKSGDEIEALADEFNNMTAALREAQTGLERKIDERTHELHVANQRLDGASRHKSQFLANVSHELRTPMNAIIGFSEVLLDPALTVSLAERKEFLGNILASGKHLLSLINELLDLSKVEAGKMEMHLDRVSVHPLVEAAVATMRPLATRKAIAVDVSVDATLPPVVADPGKINQVLLNLLGNAIKFTPDGGRVVVGAGARNGVVEIAVCDTGIGISLEDQARVFEAFQRVDSSPGRSEGTGLGLALARAFVEMHGGQIWVTSQIGHGSTFTFTLPLSKPA